MLFSRHCAALGSAVPSAAQNIETAVSELGTQVKSISMVVKALREDFKRACAQEHLGTSGSRSTQSSQVDPKVPSFRLMRVACQARPGIHAVCRVKASNDENCSRVSFTAVAQALPGFYPWPIFLWQRFRWRVSYPLVLPRKPCLVTGFGGG